MGYTHYWQPKAMDAANWQATVDDFRKLFAAVDAVLCAEYDRPTEPPIADGEAILFNGKGEQGHETFALDREALGGWSFCKTAQKPYDTAVTAALIYMAALHDYEVTSDGEPADWHAGLTLARAVWPELMPVLDVPAGVTEDR